MSAAQRRAYATGPSWPLGYYELVSLSGQDLPVRLSNGETLLGGSCRRFNHRNGGTGFVISLRYEGNPRMRRALAPRELSGMALIQEDAGVARKPIEFIIKQQGDYTNTELGGVRTYDVDEEVSGALFGNELRMVGQDEVLAFMKGRDPRRRR